MQKEYYFLIRVGSLGLKRQGSFTYSHDYKLQTGQLVRVELKKKSFLGVVISTTKKPEFKSKPIQESFNLVIPEAQLNLMQWASKYYPGEEGSITRLFLPPSLIKKKMAPDNDTFTNIKQMESAPLTKDQEKALLTIDKSPTVSILHGGTGTGKTRVYIEAAKKQLSTGKSVIVLCPEISLSEQMHKSLSASFNNIESYNSLQTMSTRRQIWQKIAESSNPHIIIGPRSALFLPVNNLGLIIIDEAHDTAYKQQQAPYYSTLQMATKLASLSGAGLIYGSATPNTSDYYKASIKGYPILKMNERPVATKTQNKTEVLPINSRDRDLFKKNGYISDAAIEQIKKSLKKGRQSLLLLNRRGTAQLLQCESCAWQYRCPNCDHTLVYHRDTHSAVCHYCGKYCPMILVCPEDSGGIKQLNIGTKYIEEVCKSLFPDENIQRIDRDSVERETIKETMESLASGSAKILVGTQLLAKGLDLPLLDTIVVLDASPQSSDFLGDERYYQLLHQVIGRGMRGHQNTTIYIQTPDTADKIVDWASKDDWEQFYLNELEERKLYKYPPFTIMATVRYSRKNPDSAEKIATGIISKISKSGLSVETLGPLPLRSIKKNTSDWLLILKSSNRDSLLKATSYAPADSIVDLEPISTY